MKRSLLLLAPLFVAACSPVFYSPSSQHIPLLSEENEFTASAGYIMAESTESMALRAAYALRPHWGVMGNGNFYFGGDADANIASGGGSFIEAGAGYFTRISKKFLFESYGLVGFGGMNNRFPQTITQYPNTNGKITAALLGLGLQPSFGFKSRYFEAALSMKTSLITYMNIQGNLITQNIDQEIPSSQQEYLSTHRHNFLLEPAITLRGGWELLKLEVQTGGSLNLTHRDFPQDGSWVSFGLVYRLSPVDRKTP